MEDGHQSRVFVHHWEGLRHDEVCDPQAERCNGQGTSTNPGRENFGKDYPGHRANRHGEGGDVSEHKDQQPRTDHLGIGSQTDGCKADAHAGRTDDHKRFATHLVDDSDCQDREDQVDATNEHGLEECHIRVRTRHGFENLRGVVKEDIDAGDLLKHREEDPDDEHDAHSGLHELGK